METLNLYEIDSISVPAGATGTTVYLDRNGTETTYTLAQALALSPSELADVTSIHVVHTGLIETEGSSTIRLVYQLRHTHRSDGTPVVARRADHQPGACGRVQSRHHGHSHRL